MSLSSSSSSSPPKASSPIVVPQVWTTGNRVDNYYLMTNGMTVSDYAAGMESFFLSGMQGEFYIELINILQAKDRNL